MPPVDKLAEALAPVDWNQNVALFLADPTVGERVAQRTMRIAVWARQLEQVEKGNPALSFVREMQSAAHQFAALSALGMYKPAAASVRAMIETALYYSFFRTHHDELVTLVRNKSYYVGKQEVIDFHKIHTPNFKDNQTAAGVVSRLDEIYSTLSAVVHGQVPGKWSTPIKLTTHNTQILSEAVSHFEEAEEIVHRFFLITIAQIYWADFSTSAKAHLLKGLPGDLRALLSLDKA